MSIRRPPTMVALGAVATIAASSKAARTAIRKRLAHPAPDELVLVASARCLTEGVDAPAVHGIFFADPRESEVDVVQARVERQGSRSASGAAW